MAQGSTMTESEVESDIHSILSNIDQYKTKQQMKNLCLIASSIVPYNQLYEAEEQSIFNVYHKLKSRKRPLRILLKMMELADFSSKHLDPLRSALSSAILNSDTETDDSEEESLDFSHQQLLVFIANNLGDKKFLKRVVNALTDAERGIAADEVDSAHTLLYHMTNAGTIGVGNYDVLVRKLNDAGFNALADKVCAQIDSCKGFDSDNKAHGEGRHVTIQHKVDPPAAVTVRCGNRHDLDPQQPGHGGAADDDHADEQRPLLLNGARANTCMRWIRKISCPACVITFIVLLLLAVVLISYRNKHVSTTQHEVELWPNDVVECDQLQRSAVNTKLHLEKNITADNSSSPYMMNLYNASPDDLKRLRMNRYDEYNYNGVFKPTQPRFTIPAIYINDHLPYLMAGSHVAVYLCLGTEKNLTNSTYAHVYLFNNRFITDDFLNNRTNSTSGAVNESSFEVGGSGNMLCHFEEYPVNDHAGYYQIVLQVPPLSSGVMVNYSVTFSIVYINSSNLAQEKQCQTPCTQKFGRSTSTILCFLQKNETSPWPDSETAYLLVNKTTNFLLHVPEARKIPGIIILLPVAFTLLVIIVLLLFYVSRKCKK